MSQDSHLQQAVLDELSWEPSVVAAHIGVAAKHGVVTLTGHVTTYAEKHAAETAAARVKGVKGVAEELRVELAFDHRRDDEDIAEAAIDRLSWNSSIPADAVKIKVESGWVTLSGEVDWHYQQDYAEQDVRRLAGVVGVSNMTTLRAHVNAPKIGDDIMHALHRSWFFDANNVKVSAVGGKIKLTGTVRSPHERQVAASTAWAAPGATSVQNDIVVV